MKYPEFIKQGDTLGFIAPSFGCNIEPYKTAFEHALEKFRSLGHPCRLGPNCDKGDGIGISSSPVNCAQEFMDFWCAGDTNALISCGGGELMCEILEYLDFDAIKAANPKWFMGYSDNTNLGFLLTTLCDVASIYGPHAPVFGMEPWHKAVQDAWELLCGQKSAVCSYDGWEKESLKSPENPLAPFRITEASTLRRMNAEAPFSGRLLGGCMDILVNLCGTKYDRVTEFLERYREDGFIWFLEACDLHPMDIRRALWHFEQAGWFRYAKGFLFGRPYYFEEQAFSLDRYSAVTGILEKYRLPVIMDADFGHLPPAMPLISGSFATVESCSSGISIQMQLK